MWPNTSCIPFCRIFWITTIIIVQFYHYQYLRKHFHFDELSNLMDCLSSFLSYTKMMTKLIVFWLNQRKFIKTLEMMAEDWDSCADNEIDMHETTHKAKLSIRITDTMIILHIVTVVLYSTRIILANTDVTDCTHEAPYIHKMELPFDVNTQKTYKMILFTQTAYVLMASMVTGAINAMLLTLVLHVGGQMDILRYWLINFAFKNCEKKNEPITTEKIIQKHQKIINFSKTIEILYMYIALPVFVFNTIIICSLAFLIVSAIGAPDATMQIIRSVLFYTITNLEAFIFCFAGEYLNNKSKAIGNAAYNTAWYNLKPKDSRILSFIILRSQKQLTLTIGKMANLSLEHFANIMSASGSYLSVMLAMQ